MFISSVALRLLRELKSNSLSSFMTEQEVSLLHESRELF